MSKVVSILQATVAPEREEALVAAFEANADRDDSPHLIQSFLVRDKFEPGVWRVVSIWPSQEDLDAHRQSVRMPTGMLAFRSVDATFSPSVSEVVAEH